MNKTKQRVSATLTVFLLGCGALFLVSCASEAPKNVSFKQTMLYPEAVEWDAANSRWLVTSLRKGVIGAVSDAGEYTPFIENEKMISAIGLEIDADRNRLLVCNSDPGVGEKTIKEMQGKTAALAIFDLKTGELKKYVEMHGLKDGGHFCNDIALDGEGNAYISDSFNQVIFKVTPAGEASILVDDDRFSGQGFNLNGIVYSDKGYLLVAKYNEGLLFKVPLDDPSKFTQVQIDETFPGADGLHWAEDGALMLAANKAGTMTNKVIELRSEDDWATAQVSGEIPTGDVFATTMTLRQGKLFVLYAYLHKLYNPETKVHQEEYQIKQVEF